MKNVIEIKDLSFGYEKNKNVLCEANLLISFERKCVMPSFSALFFAIS